MQSIGGSTSCYSHIIFIYGARHCLYYIVLIGANFSNQTNTILSLHSSLLYQLCLLVRWQKDIDIFNEWPLQVKIKRLMLHSSNKFEKVKKLGWKCENNLSAFFCTEAIQRRWDLSVLTLGDNIEITKNIKNCKIGHIIAYEKNNNTGGVVSII